MAKPKEIEIKQTAQIALAIQILREKVGRVIGTSTFDGTLVITADKITFQENVNVKI